MTNLTALAQHAARGLAVAELHGAVCGLAACHGVALPLQDLVALVGVDALTDQQAVEQFVTASVEDLTADDMSFVPLLPAADAALEDRLEALGQWCGSFLAGLAAGLSRCGVGSLEDTPEDVREIIRDFAAIAEIDTEAETATQGGDEAARAATEAAEADYAELEEFVKVGALLIMSTLGHDPDDQAH